MFMGCSVSSLCKTSKQPEMFTRSSDSDVDGKATLEQKLYLAKESPEPVFDLSDCKLKQVPSGIYSICKVFRKDYLYLNNNKLTSLEDGGSLRDLYLVKVLNISGNKFTQLHNDIKYLASLTELYLQENELKGLPESIQNLQSLRILDISKNRLKELTPSLGNLKSLRKLNITDNPSLTKLCPELCLASNIVSLNIDIDRISFPQPSITSLGTAEIMKFLCEYLNVEYIPPASHSENSSPVLSPGLLQNPFTRQPVSSWEEQEAAMIEQENRIHEASKQQREMFLSTVLKEQSVLDDEIAKVQELKEIERQKLIKAIQEEEKSIQVLVNSFMQSTDLNPEVIQQQLQHEEAELNRLLDITRQSYDEIKKNDILKAMESLIEENCAFQQSKKNYDDYVNNIKGSMLAQELESTEKLEQLLKAKDESRTALVEQLLEDQDIQKAMVASLLEKVDSRSWSLNQEISIITSNLARLSIIEQEKQKLNITYNYNQLLHQRVLLLGVLGDLLDQQNKRRSQLIETLKEMENDSSKSTHDFWLSNYQKLLDSAPKHLLDAGKTLDPQLANNLLQEGVIHCLPFLVKFLFSEGSLVDVTDDKLKANGVQLTIDRKNILKAIEDYVTAKSKLSDLDNEVVVPATAPPLSPEVSVEEPSCNGVVDSNNVDNGASESECVICMDAKCEIVFVPCGHMCCCLPCSNNEMQCCPMCRGDIDRKIRVLLP